MNPANSQLKVDPISVGRIYETNRAEWNLEFLAGKAGSDREVSTFELSRPGLALAGYFDVFAQERLQLFGLTEISFLADLPPKQRRESIRRTFEFPIPGVIITRGLEVFPEMIELAEKLGVPLLRTDHITSSFQAEIGQYLELCLAPRWNLHGVMVDVYGLGVLLQGESGVGKSECALELVQRGHLLVADDVVVLRRLGSRRLIAEPTPSLGYHMEIRGVGIINLELLFGVKSVRESSEVSLIVELERWREGKEYDRLGLDMSYRTLFGCPLPLVVLPVEPGRNMANIVEVAALMQRLRKQGKDVVGDFDRRMKEMIESRYRGEK